MEKFLKKCYNKFGNNFDYSEMVYINSATKIKIRCVEHDEYFLQVPSEHLRGKKCCKFCRKKTNKILDKPKKSKTLNNEEFIKRSIKKHGNKYNYSLVNYINSVTKVKIICPEHGEFEQAPASHIRGKNCKLCAIENTKKKLSFNSENFITKSNIIHNNKYDYSLVDYINSHTKVKIICPEHGEFEQLPYDHIKTHGCNKCTSSVSKIENNINDFINSLSLKTIQSSMSIIPSRQLDIYIPSHNLAIEYNGLYWHSELFKESNYHLNKTELCESKNIRLIHIFEDEWEYKQDIVKSRIKNILGITNNKKYARKCEIKEVSSKDSREFLDKNHIQGGVTASIKIGLYYNGELVSLMIFSKPRLGIGKNNIGYELSRFCNKLDTNVIGGASKLLNYFIKTYKPKEITSYADRRWSNGDLYKKLGFLEIKKNKPNYWYIFGKIRRHRFGFRKHILIKNGYNIENKTEHQIMFENGIYRIYDCGTIRYTLKLD